MAGIVAIPTSGMGGGSTSLNLLDYYIANQSSLTYKQESVSVDSKEGTTKKFTINGKGFFIYCEYYMYNGNSKIEFIADDIAVKTLTIRHLSKKEYAVIGFWAGGYAVWNSDFKSTRSPSGDLHLSYGKTTSFQGGQYPYTSIIASYEAIKFNNKLDIVLTYPSGSTQFVFGYYLFK